MTRHIIPISGKDSLCCAIVQVSMEPNLPYEFVFCDVGMELPETYAWLSLVEKSLGIQIKRLGKSLLDIMAELEMLPSHHRRFCTKLGKIFPLRDFLAEEEGKVIQYLGIRADEQRVGAGAFNRPNVEFNYPLVRLGIDLPGVYRILQAKDLMPPDFFWKRLYDVAYPGCSEYSRKWLDNSEPWVKSHLFSWRSRSNCFMCFYQSLYEWVGLLEHHPDLFDKAERLEFDYGHCSNRDRTEKSFYWRQDMPLSRIRDRAKFIFQKRVWKVQEAIVDMRHRAEDGETNLISLTSCGAYCGK